VIKLVAYGIVVADVAPPPFFTVCWQREALSAKHNSGTVELHIKMTSAEADRHHTSPCTHISTSLLCYNYTEIGAILSSQRYGQYFFFRPLGGITAYKTPENE